MTTCPADEVWTALLTKRLSEADEAAFYQHCATCTDCQRMFGALGEPASFSSAGDQSQSPPTAPMQGPAWSADPWAPPPTFAEFRVRRPLGRGNMGQVFIAHDMVLDRPVAVKFISSLGRKEKERFLVEARAIARLNHPNVVTLYRVGELDGRPYLVSELISGESLDHLPVPIPWQRALAIGKDLTAGLAEAHRRGVLHRDIKPANVILSKSGAVKILDFGLARLSQLPALEQQRLSHSIVPHKELSLTQPGALLGTPLYMSPEAWEGKESIPQMDVYAVGALLYELCTGAPPHVAGHLAALRWKAQQEDITPLGARVKGVDPAFAQVVERCLQRDPAARFPSAVELHQALTQPLPAPGRASFSDDPTNILSRIQPLSAPAALPAPVALPTTVATPVVPTLAAGLPLPAAAPAVAAPLPRAVLPPQRKQRRWPTRAGLVLLGLSVLVAAPAWWLWSPGQKHQEMVLLPGGEFLMGSSKEEIAAARATCEQTVGADCQPEFFERESQQRRVRVSPFYLDATEVTNAHFAAWLNQLPGLQTEFNRLLKDPQRHLLADLYPSTSNGLVLQSGKVVPIPGREHHPVVQVTWDAALLYCQAQGKDLPTEAQWEFAARGPEGHRFPWGDGEPRCDGVVFGRKADRDCKSRSPRPEPVGSSRQDRSAQGVYDLGGNVSEWVSDRFRTAYPTCRSACVDPQATMPVLGEPEVRVVRGGNWLMPGESCRAAGRIRMAPEQANGNIGFRCARLAR